MSNVSNETIETAYVVELDYDNLTTDDDTCEQECVTTEECDYDFAADGECTAVDGYSYECKTTEADWFLLPDTDEELEAFFQ